MKPSASISTLHEQSAFLSTRSPDAVASIEAAHVQLRKFISPFGLLQDYVGELPTASDCAECRPNAKGWWTPIENGPMFTGDVACRRLRPCGSERGGGG